MAGAERQPTVIRAALVEDAEAIGGIAQRSWAATYPGIVPESVLADWIAEAPESWRNALAAIGADSPARVWVGERDGRVLGYATTSPAKDNWLPPPDGAEMMISNPRRLSFGTRSWKTLPSSVSLPGFPFCNSSMSTFRWLTRERGGM